MEFKEKIEKELKECKNTINSDIFKKEVIEVLEMLVEKVVFLDGCCGELEFIDVEIDKAVLESPTKKPKKDKKGKK